MKTINKELLSTLLKPQKPPCVSLYQPTHRRHPENQQDPLRFRKLREEMEASLLQRYSRREVGSIMEPFAALGEDRDFWNHTLEGLAIFGAEGVFHVFGLQRAVPELVVVAESFHTKPLWRFLQSADRFQVLALSFDEIKLFQGTRDVLDEVELASGVPRDLTEALGEELTESHQTVASYGGTGAGRVPMRHGHGGRSEESDVDMERFFRVVDTAILEHHSRPSELPLVLAALPEQHGHFRRISRNPFLTPEGVKVNPFAIGVDDLREEAWKVFKPRYEERLESAASQFEVAKSRGLGLDDVGQVARAAVSGRIATLLLDEDRNIPGKIDLADGSIQPADLSHPEVDDLLDDLGEVVLQRGGEVVVLPGEMMPTETGVAAICRF